MRKMITDRFLEAGTKWVYPIRQVPVSYINATDAEHVSALLDEVHNIARARINDRRAVAAAKNK